MFLTVREILTSCHRIRVSQIATQLVCVVYSKPIAGGCVVYNTHSWGSINKGAATFMLCVRHARSCVYKLILYTHSIIHHSNSVYPEAVYSEPVRFLVGSGSGSGPCRKSGVSSRNFVQPRLVK